MTLERRRQRTDGRRWRWWSTIYDDDNIRCVVHIYAKSSLSRFWGETDYINVQKSVDHFIDWWNETRCKAEARFSFIFSSNNKILTKKLVSKMALNLYLQNNKKNLSLVFNIWALLLNCFRIYETIWRRVL